MFYNSDDIFALDNVRKAKFINSLGGFKSINLIGTINKNNQSNLAIFNSIVHIGANPPLIGFFTRPNSVERHTLQNILETRYYTFNHINKKIYEKAHQTSARYDASISEFDEVGLTAEFKNDFKAPFVQESIVQIGIAFKQKIDIEINSTILIIGEIVQVVFPKECLCADGYLDIEKSETITGSGLDSYHTTARLERLSYAKPDINLTTIPIKYVE